MNDDVPFDVTEEKEETEKKPLTKAEAKTLFESWWRTEQNREAAAEALKDASQACSNKVKAIFEALGTGPFEWKGDVMTVLKRQDTFFFRGKTKKEVVKIG